MINFEKSIDILHRVTKHNRCIYRCIYLKQSLSGRTIECVDGPTSCVIKHVGNIKTTCQTKNHYYTVLLPQKHIHTCTPAEVRVRHGGIIVSNCYNFHYLKNEGHCVLVLRSEVLEQFTTLVASETKVVTSST